MTAPSLLDELEEVVRLTDKATPGAWSLWGTPTPSQAIQSPDKLVMQTLGGNDVPNAEAVAAAMNFIRTHHAEIADMAKRLEAAERDAFKWQLLCADCDDAGEGNRAAINVVNDACRLGSGALERHYGQAAREGLDAIVDAATQEGEG